MDSEANVESDFFKNTEQLINSMMSFLDEPTDENHTDECDELKNPLCWGIKRIINILPTRPDPQRTLYENRIHANQIEKVCRHKDPYMQEINRLMFSSSVGHPANGSPEYYQAAENYALFGKEFLDFPTDIKFPQPLDVGCFGEVTNIPSSLEKTQSVPGLGMQMGQYTKQQTSSNSAQQQILVNQTNYCSYPYFQPQSLAQPLIYANPFLMTQYLNTFVKETHINTSLVQQQQFLTGGIHERLVYAQMLQQQIQTNQAALMSSYFMGSTAGGSSVKGKNDMRRTGHTYGCDGNSALLKSDLDSGGMEDNSSIE